MIGSWAAAMDLDKAIDVLVAAGVPAAPATDPRRASDHPQFVARQFYERVDHPVVGAHPTAGLPWRQASVEHWIQQPAPTLGQHNHDVLSEWLGCTDEEIAALAADRVIGTWPLGV